MASKVHPKSFRLATVQTWDSMWFSKDDFPRLLQEDEKIRLFLRKRLKDSGVDRVMIERSLQQVTITVYAAKPGFIIGRAGSGIEELKKELLKKIYPGRRVAMNINVKEVGDPALSAELVGQQIASDIERRLPFRRSMKGALERTMKAGAQGAKITVAGRLNGADIARREKVAAGKVPLHNLRADINYARVTARTVYGAIGITVWINRGEKFDDDTHTT